MLGQHPAEPCCTTSSAGWSPPSRRCSGVSLVVFMMVRLLPGDPARVVAGLLASEADVEHIRHQLGLDQPAPVQYAAFLARLVHFDLGTSVRSGQPVLNEVLARLPCTAELAATSIALAAIWGSAPAWSPHCTTIGGSTRSSRR